MTTVRAPRVDRVAALRRAIEGLVRDTDAGMAAELVELWLEGVDARLATLAAATDASALGRAAHALKGQSCLFGLDGVTGACEDLEARQRAGEEILGASQSEAVAREVEAIRAALFAELEALRAQPTDGGETW